MIGNIIIMILSILSAPQIVYAATEKDCVIYKSEHLIKIVTPFRDWNGCDWLIDRYLGLNYTLGQYLVVGGSDVWVLVK